MAEPHDPGGGSPPFSQDRTEPTFKSLLSSNTLIVFNQLHALSPLDNSRIDIAIQEVSDILKSDKVTSISSEWLNDLKGLGRRLIEANGRKVDYNKEDGKPYLVNVESIARNIAGLHYSDLSKMLHQLGIRGVKDVKKTGYNKVGVTFETHEDANNLLYKKELRDRNLKAYIPQTMLSTKGIIRDVGFSIDPEDIMGDSEGRTRITEAKRISRRVGKGSEAQFVPTRTFLLTFEGKKLPNEVRLYNVNYKVDIYIRSVTQCFKCLRYGHAKKFCRGKFRCSKCGEEHTRDVCNRKEPNEMECCICRGNHEATSKDCPEMTRQKLINETMAMENITFFEACLRFPATYLTSRNPIRNNRNLDFPTLLSPQRRNMQKDVQPISQKTSKYEAGTSYSQRSQIKRIEIPRTPKKRMLSRSPVSDGYDKEANRRCLFPSANRVRVEELPQFKMFSAERQEASDSQERSDIRDRWWNEEKMEEDMTNLKENQRSKDTGKEKHTDEMKDTTNKVLKNTRNKKETSTETEREKKQETTRNSLYEGDSPFI